MMQTSVAWWALIRFNGFVYRSFELLAALAILIVVVAIIYQVVGRYFGLEFKFLFGGAPWSEDVALFSFVWACMLGNALAVRDESHLVADVLPETLGRTGDRLMASLSYLVHLILGVVFLIWGYSYAEQGWLRYSEVLSYPMFYMFVALPLSGVAILTFVVERFIVTWTRQ